MDVSHYFSSDVIPTVASDHTEVHRTSYIARRMRDIYHLLGLDGETIQGFRVAIHHQYCNTLALRKSCPGPKVRPYISAHICSKLA